MIHNNKNRYAKGYLNNRIKKSIEAVVNEIRNTVRDEINSHQEKKEIAEKKKGRDGVKWTDIAMVVISGFLAYYTFQLFNKTII